MTLADEFKQKIRESLKDSTLTSCSRWAAHRRLMGNPFPGPYNWKHHPWVREMHDSWAPMNVAMKGAQLGVTEVAINRAFYTLDQLRRDVLYVLPTALNASDFSKSRFSTALSLSPHLSAMFTDTNTVNLKQAGSNTLYIRGSRGDSNLKSIPASALILDELDEMDQKQIWLAFERLSGQLEKHIWALSTPTIPERGIHRLYKDSTQEHFIFQCPCCSRKTELIWPDCIEIIGETLADPRCHESYLKCKECGGRLNHEDKPSFLSKAKWESTAPNGNPDVRGFAISQLYSFTVTPGELVVAYFRGLGDELANKEFHNSKLGLPFIGEGAKISEDMVNRSVGSHRSDDPRPKTGGQRIITMGVDQGKWNYVTIVEWFVEGSPGFDINAAAKGKLLWAGKFFEEDWNILDQLMVEWQVIQATLDADPQINEARRFARRFPGHVHLCRYRRGQTGKEISITEEDDGAPMATVDRTNWMSAALSRFKSDPTRMELPTDVPREFVEHIQSPVRTYQREERGKTARESESPRAVYVETGPDHYAHAMVYAELSLALYAGCGVNQNIESV